MKYIFWLPLLLWLIQAEGYAANLNDVLRSQGDSAFVYCKSNQLDTSFCILINMGMHSGKNWLFVWDFNQDRVVRAGLVCHGMGKGSTGARPVFSNQPGSYCTSLGKYRIGDRGYSKWGIHVLYRLHGLEATNDNALKRLVVLHSYTYVPDREIYPQHLPMGYSLGCPVVSETLMHDLDQRLKEAKLPVLLWIYCE